MPWKELLRKVHLGCCSCPAGTVTQTQIIRRKLHKLLSHKVEGYQDINMVNSMVYIQLNPTLRVYNSWHSRKPDTEWTDLSLDKHPCLLHGWVVTHFAKQASSRRRKQQHEGGNTLPSRLYLHADITTWSLKLFPVSPLLTDTWGSADWRHPGTTVND